MSIDSVRELDRRQLEMRELRGTINDLLVREQVAAGRRDRYRMVLERIASGSVEDPVQLAREALA